MNDLVSVIGNKPMTDSLLVAKHFEKEHFRVLRAIENLECSEEFRASNFGLSSYKSKQGKDLPMYRMTRDGFTFLCMGFTGAKAAKWKEAYIKAFNAMESRLLRLAKDEQVEWKQARLQGKDVRVSTWGTCVKEFVEYCKAQGSKSAEKYYVAITSMEYKALGLIEQKEKVPSHFRDTLDLMDLSFLMTAELTAVNAIRYGMEKGMGYKDIFQLAKQDVMRFADSVNIRRIGEPKRINPPDLPDATA